MKSPSHKERGNKILKAIIENFISIGKPVSSQSLSEMFDLSPATIRHVMVELEQSEYITQSHPSSGRIPTDKGYREYVDSLMEDEPLKEREKKDIIQGYEHITEYENVIQKTSYLLSSSSHYLGITLETKLQQVYLEGFSNLLEQSEFNNIEILKKVFKICDDKGLLYQMLMKYSEKGEISIIIGQENPYKDFYECSLIISRYKIEGNPRGMMGVIGPKRMTYPHVISVVKFITETINELVNKDLIRRKS